MLKNSEKGFLTLIRSGIQNCYLSLPQDFSIDSILVAAKEHSVVNIVYNGAVNCGIDANLPAMKKLFSLALRETVIDQKQLEEYEKLSGELIKKKISFLPLKGILLKSMYPYTYFRSMKDVDILIKPKEYKQVKQVLIANGYEFYCEGDHEFIWNKKGILNLECHKSLAPSYDIDFYNYYTNIWDKVETDGEIFRLSDEDVFIYTFVHFVKHYRSCGIGIKPLIDIYFFMKREGLNWDYIEIELKKLNILEFFNNIKDAIEQCFNGTELSEKTEFILSYILDNGEFGRKELGEFSAVLRSVGKSEKTNKYLMKVFLKNFFPSYINMKRKYTYLEKHPYLLPISWLVRILSAIFKGKKVHINKVDVQKVKMMEENLKYVGLSYNFRE